MVATTSAPTSPAVGPGAMQDPEAWARRALGLDAVWFAGVGLGSIVAGGTIGRAVELPATAVRLAGAAALGWAGTVGVWSIAEAWRPPTRRVLWTNVAGSTALLGHAVARGSRGGRLALAVAAVGTAGFALVQGRALVDADRAGRGF